MDKNLYIEIWEKSQEQIKFLYEGKTSQVKMNESDFTKVGNRILSGYNFRLRFCGTIFNHPSGSAVARDLSLVLNKNSRIIELAKQKQKDLRMKDFVLYLV